MQISLAMIRDMPKYVGFASKRPFLSPEMHREYGLDALEITLSIP